VFQEIADMLSNQILLKEEAVVSVLRLQDVEHATRDAIVQLKVDETKKWDQSQL
jgi:hypothetical protein